MVYEEGPSNVVSSDTDGYQRKTVNILLSFSAARRSTLIFFITTGSTSDFTDTVTRIVDPVFHNLRQAIPLQL